MGTSTIVLDELKDAGATESTLSGVTMRVPRRCTAMALKFVQHLGEASIYSSELFNGQVICDLGHLKRVFVPTEIVQTQDSLVLLAAAPSLEAEPDELLNWVKKEWDLYTQGENEKSVRGGDGNKQIVPIPPFTDVVKDVIICGVPSLQPTERVNWDMANKVWPLSGPRPRERLVVRSTPSDLDLHLGKPIQMYVSLGGAATPCAVNCHAVFEYIVWPLASALHYENTRANDLMKDGSSARFPVVSVVCDLSRSGLASDLHVYSRCVGAQPAAPQPRLPDAVRAIRLSWNTGCNKQGVYLRQTTNDQQTALPSAYDAGLLGHLREYADKATGVGHPTFDALQEASTSSYNFLVSSASADAASSYLCNNLDLVSSIEPCLMCSMACVHSRIRSMIYHEMNVGHGGTSGLGVGGHRLHTVASLNHHFKVFKVVVEK